MSARLHGTARWLAILAMSLQCLWPLIAQAKPRAVTLVPICTVAGETHYMEVETGGGGVASHAEHCKACPVGAVALASDAFRPDALPPQTAAVWAAYRQQAEKRLVSHARPRAPPSFLAVEVISDNQEKTNEKGVVLRPRA